MAKHLGAYSSLHGPAGKTLTDYTELNIPQLWNSVTERITNVGNDGTEYTGTIPGYTIADPLVLTANKFFLFTPHVHNNANCKLSLNGLPLRPILEPSDRTPLPVNALVPGGEYLLWYKNNAFERILNFRTLSDDIRVADKVIQLLPTDVSIANYAGTASIIATGGHTLYSDAGGKFWRRGTTTAPSAPAFFRRQDFDGVWYEAITKRTIFGEEVGIVGNTTATNFGEIISDVIDWLATVGGGRLILPPGRIDCDSNIRVRGDGIRIEGTAAGVGNLGGTVLRMNLNRQMTIGGDITIGQDMNYQIQIANLGIEQEAGTTAYYFSSSAVRGLHFSDIHMRGIYGFHASGNTLGGSTPNFTYGCTYQNITGNLGTDSLHFLRCANSGNFSMRNVAIDGPDTIISDSSAIYLPVGAVSRPDACNITACRFTSFDRTLRIDSGITNLFISNSVFNRCGTNAVHFNPDILIAGVRFSNCSFIAAQPPTMAQIGMHLADNGTTGRITRVSVQDSQFLYWGKNAISIADPNLSTMIQNCQFEDNCAADLTENESVIAVGTQVDQISITNNQIYKGTLSPPFDKLPAYGIRLGTDHSQVVVTNNQINQNQVRVAPLYNPNRGPAHLRRIHNNTLQVFEGQVVTVGPWTQVDLPAGSGTGSCELSGLPTVAAALLTRRGKVVAIACRGNRGITSAANSLRFEVLRDSISMDPIFRANSTGDLGVAEFFNEDLDGHDFDAGNTLSVRWTADFLTYDSALPSADWNVYLSVYYD